MKKIAVESILNLPTSFSIDQPSSMLLKLGKPIHKFKIHHILEQGVSHI